MEKINLFSTDIWKTHVKEWKSKKEEILSLVPEYDQVKKPDFTKKIEIFYTDYYDFDSQNVSEYRNKFLDLISPYIKEFASKTPKKKIVDIKNIWCQKYDEGQFHPFHDHGPFGYSSVFYANIDENYKSGTYFHSPYFDEYSSKREFQIDVVEGDLIFFPSYVPHFSPPIPSDKKRIIISFNMGV